MDITSDLRGIAVALVGTSLLTLASFLWRKRNAVRRWQLPKPDSLKIILSTSHAYDTGEYQRPTTGVGQTKAIALLAPSLVRAHRSVDLQGIILSVNSRGDDLEGDLLLIGGPKTNEVTKTTLGKLADHFGIAQHESVIQAGSRSFVGNVEGGEVSEDYGIVIRAESPFASGRRVVILSGSHTFGTVTAARYFAEAKLPRTDFAVVVRSDIIDGHALKPELVWESGDARSH